MRLKNFLERIDFTRVIIVSLGYIFYIAFALYNKIGNETVNILLISSTSLYLLMYLFIGRDDVESMNHHVKKKAKLTYKWFKRFIHVVNALYIVISIVFYEEEGSPYTILFKYVTIVNFIVQVLASLFRFLLRKQTDKMMVERKRIRGKKRKKQRSQIKMEYRFVYGKLEEIDASFKKEATEKERFLIVLNEIKAASIQRAAIYVGSFLQHENKFQLYLELARQILRNQSVLIIFVQDIPTITELDDRDTLLGLIHPRIRHIKRKETALLEKQSDHLEDLYLFYLAEKKMKHSEVIRRAFLPPDLPVEKWNKNQLLSVSLVLHLSIQETNRLLHCIHHRLLENSRKDIIVTYFLKKGIFDPQVIEFHLYHLDCDSLFFYS